MGSRGTIEFDRGPVLDKGLVFLRGLEFVRGLRGPVRSPDVEGAQRFGASRSATVSQISVKQL